MFQASHQATELAVKTLRCTPRRRADERRYLMAEIDLLDRVDHPNLVRIVGVGMVNDGSPAYVMLRGTKTVSEVLRTTGPPSRPWVEQVLTDVASGLKALHRAGCWHGDVHGANVLLFDDSIHNMAKLIDPKPWRPCSDEQGDLAAFGQLADELRNRIN